MRVGVNWLRWPNGGKFDSRWAKIWAWSNSSQLDPSGWPNDTQLHRSCELGSSWLELGVPFGQGLRNYPRSAYGSAVWRNVFRCLFGALKFNLNFSRKLDGFIHCCYASAAVPGVRCDSPGNEFSSCDDLMKSGGLRACLWILGTLAFLGNISVILWRTTLGRDNRVHSFLLTNLAFSDLFMGIYLLIIAIKDAQWQGEYFKHDIDWRESFVCQLAGVLSMLSSEVSVLMLTLITTDRLICIVFPFSRARLTWTKAYASCGLVWMFGCVISGLPMTGLEYFKNEKNRAEFYGRSAVCLPLQLSESKPAGWEYSVSFFLAMNLAAFVFILVAYMVIFWTVKKSSGSIRSTKMSQDAAMARKLVFILLTDFCCWMPVIVIGILSLTGNFYDPGKTAYVIIAIFVLPVNSSINPILYTFSNTNVRQAIVKTSRRLNNRMIGMGKCALSDDDDDDDDYYYYYYYYFIIHQIFLLARDWWNRDTWPNRADVFSR